MKFTLRWFGEQDPVKLEHIRQIPGCSGVMGMHDNFEAGEVWDKEFINNMVKKANDNGLEYKIIESINVHEDIKLGLETRDKYIENYIESIKNVAEAGIEVVVYNFMPVFDWLKTDLFYELKDGSKTLSYNHELIQDKNPLELVNNIIEGAGNFQLPGWEPERLKELEKILKLYENISDEKLFEHYKYFLDRVIPICEEYGIKLAVHPDDPAWPVFNIPRITHKVEHLRRIISMVDSPSNTLCICTGSLASNKENNIIEIIKEFSNINKIGAMHIRNIKFEGDKKFYESSHLSTDGDLDMYGIMKTLIENNFDGYVRPDHGRMIWEEIGRPGYGLYDRALGLTYLNGLKEGIEKSMFNN